MPHKLSKLPEQHSVITARCNRWPYRHRMRWQAYEISVTVKLFVIQALGLGAHLCKWAHNQTERRQWQAVGKRVNSPLFLSLLPQVLSISSAAGQLENSESDICTRQGKAVPVPPPRNAQSMPTAQLLCFRWARKRHKKEMIQSATSQGAHVQELDCLAGH